MSVLVHVVAELDRRIMIRGRRNRPVHLPLLQAERSRQLTRLNMGRSSRLNLSEHLRGGGSELWLAGHDGGDVFVHILSVVRLDHFASVPSVSQRTDQWRVIGEAS